MSAWTTSAAPTPCGLCGGDIAPGTTYLALVLVSRTVARCQSCAGEPVPEVIADSGRVYQVAQFAERIEAMRAGRDWKHAQAGEGGR